MSAADWIDNSPMGKLFTAMIHEGPEMLARGVGRVLDGAASVYDTAVAGIGSVIDGAKDLIPSMPRMEAAVAEQAPKIEAPQVAQVITAHHVGMEDLGQFSAPTFGTFSSGQGQGIA